jgi:uncharacterized Zn-binding protein involved in type VI secretion
MGDDAPTPDAATTADASPDASEIPLAGKPCTKTVTEVGRITGAAAPQNVSGLFTRDADNDGKADVLLFEFVSSTTTDYRYRIKLWRRDTTGFMAPTSSEFNIPRYGLEQLTVGDWNGDDRLDVAIVHSSETQSPFSRTPVVYVATQSSTGTFSLTQSRLDISACKSSSDERDFGLAAMDFDRDGDDDLLATVSYNGLGAAPEGLTMLKGSPTGLTTGACISSATVTINGVPQVHTAEQLIVGDYNNDGHQDLVANIFDKGLLFYSTGASTFANPPGLPGIPSSRTFANIIKDRPKNDMVSVSVTSAGSAVHRYALDPVTGIAGSMVAMLGEKDASGFSIVRGAVAGDMNGDGLTDVLVAGRQENVTPTTFAMTCDRAKLWESVTGSFPDSVHNLRAIDVEGDGRSEILGRTANGDLAIFKID